MALPVFPSYIKLASSYDEEVDIGLIRTSMDSGVAKQRARYSTPIINRSVKLVAKSLKAKTDFDKWWCNDVRGGWFSYLDPLRGNASTNARIKTPIIKWRMISRELWDCVVEIESVGVI